MSRRITMTFDEHDYDQLILLAKLNKIRVHDLVLKIVKAHLDRNRAPLREEAGMK